jgi:hypothetical protein
LIIHNQRVARAIATGTATQHRYIGAPLKAGHDYPVKTSSHQPATCRIRIASSRLVAAGEITFKDARREGYRTTVEFEAHWVQTYDARWFEANTYGGVYDEWVVHERFTRRHAHRIVNVVTFELVTDEPRFLASQYDILHGHTDRGEFTTRKGKAIDDLEVVDEATTARFAEAAALLAEAQRRERNDMEQDVYRQQRHRKRNRRLSMFKPA